MVHKEILFLDDLARYLLKMRLIAEGAAVLFDQSRGKFDALAVDMIGEALYFFRDNIQEIQEAMVNAMPQKAAEEAVK